MATAPPDLGSFTAQFSAGTHCPGLLCRRKREGINLSPQAGRSGVVEMRDDTHGRNLGGDGRREVCCVGLEKRLQTFLKVKGIFPSLFPCSWR